MGFDARSALAKHANQEAGCCSAAGHFGPLGRLGLAVIPGPSVYAQRYLENEGSLRARFYSSVREGPLSLTNGVSKGKPHKGAAWSFSDDCA